MGWEKAGTLTNSGQVNVIVRQRGDGLQPVDRRVARTRRALLDAFVVLVQERSYGSIRISDIVGHADVGRSTFYEHFQDKDVILLASMEWIFAVLADAVIPNGPRQPLDKLAMHFWSNRRLARAVLAHPIQPKLARALAREIEERLVDGETVNQPLRAVGIAAGQLGVLAAWVRGELTASASQVTDELLATARAR